jgi:hypothetical protein
MRNTLVFEPVLIQYCRQEFDQIIVIQRFVF